MPRLTWIQFSTVVVVAVLALTACTAPGSHHSPSSSPRPTASASAPVAPTFPAIRSAAGDGTEQHLANLVVSGHNVVAVGGDNSGGIGRPLLLRSGDDGRTWVRGSVTAASARNQTTGDSAEAVASRGHQFVAVGSGENGPAVWASADGLSWTREGHQPAAFHQNDTIESITADAAGYVAVGTSEIGQQSVPVAWTSPNGTTWTRRVAGLQIPVDQTNVSLASVAASPAGLLVAVGSANNETSMDKPDVAVIWRSGNQGATWTRDQLSPDLGGHGTRNWLVSVRWIGDRFIAVGTGGSEVDQIYSAVVASSLDGVGWSAEYDEPVLKTQAQTYPTDVAAVSSELLVVGSREATTTTPLAALGNTASTWVAAAVPSAAGASAVAIEAAATTATGGVLMVGSQNPHGDADAAIWSSSDGLSIRSVPLPAVAKSLDATTAVNDIAYGDGRYAAVGTSSGVPAVWTSTDGTHFGAPTALGPVKQVPTRVSFGPSGWLVTGYQAAGVGYQGLDWTSRDARKWTPGKAGEFGVGGEFSYNSFNAVTAYASGWVAVGDASTNGNPVQSATVWRSPNGTAWSQPDPMSHRTQNGAVIYDLYGGAPAPGGGTRAMYGVTPVGTGLVAVGTAQPSHGASTSNPAVWASPDGRHWRISLLPRPPGTGNASIDSVLARGRTVVGYGSVSPSSGVGDQLYTWTSTDAGAHWTAKPLGALVTGAGVESAAHLVTPSGFALFATGGTAVQAPLLWTSPDGLHWTATPFADPALHRSGDWTIDGCAMVGAVAHCVATSAQLSGASPITFTQKFSS